MDRVKDLEKSLENAQGKEKIMLMRELAGLYATRSSTKALAVNQAALDLSLDLYDEALASVSELKQRLEHNTREDNLTGLPNRRYILDVLQAERIRFRRTIRSFVIILGDIDNFNQINEKLTNRCGDELLMMVGRMFGAMLRQQDYLARWGSDQFMMLLPETDLKGGRILAEKLRDRLASTPFVLCDKEVYVTLTFGVAIYDREMEVEECIKNAVGVLKEGKKGGKNTVAVSVPSWI